MCVFYYSMSKTFKKIIMKKYVLFLIPIGMVCFLLVKITAVSFMVVKFKDNNLSIVLTLFFFSLSLILGFIFWKRIRRKTKNESRPSISEEEEKEIDSTLRNKDMENLRNKTKEVIEESRNT